MQSTRRLLAVLTMAATLLIETAGVVSAGSPVDPELLTPPPPPGATCSDDGRLVICATTFNGSATNEMAFELSCGQVYVTSTDVRVGRRWYEEGLLVRRHVVQNAFGTWSLSPTGDGPLVSFVAKATLGEVYPVPGDESSQVGHTRGTDLLARSADGGVLAHVSGRSTDEGFTGLFRIPEDPALDAAICAALGA
jgi:hypothetical protein